MKNHLFLLALYFVRSRHRLIYLCIKQKFCPMSTNNEINSMKYPVIVLNFRHRNILNYGKIEHNRKIKYKIMVNASFEYINNIVFNSMETDESNITPFRAECDCFGNCVTSCPFFTDIFEWKIMFPSLMFFGWNLLCTARLSLFVIADFNFRSIAVVTILNIASSTLVLLYFHYCN